MKVNSLIGEIEALRQGTNQYSASIDGTMSSLAGMDSFVCRFVVFIYCANLSMLRHGNLFIRRVVKLEGKKGIEVDKLDRLLMLQGDSLTRTEALEERALHAEKTLL